MEESERRFKIALVVLGLVHLVGFCAFKYWQSGGIDGVLFANVMPVGDDFINLWSTAQLILAGRFEDIYLVDRFMAYQGSFTDGAYLGLRLWAYPAHSLLLAWPLGLLGYYPALVVWSVLGLAILFLGARRFGFDRLETAVILTSPATALNLYHGQTGALATGLLLLALSARSSRDLVSVTSAAVLTIKPQTGFLLPLLWAFQRRWVMILATAIAVVVLGLLTLALFGSQVWRDYLGDTLPTLSKLERHGTGPFMSMIPSAFMAMRILTSDSDLALIAHAGFAVAVAMILVFRMARVQDTDRRAALLLIATALMTPYLHNYDLAVLLCGALLVARHRQRVGQYSLLSQRLVLAAWALPQVVTIINPLGVPISPLVILPLLFLA